MNKIVILSMVGVVFALLSIIKVYTYRRFLRHSFLFKNRKWLAIALLVVLGIGEMLLFVVRDRHFSEIQYMLVGLCVVVDYCLFMACLFGDVLKILTKSIGKQSRHIDSILNPTPDSPSRRAFLKIIFDLGIIAIFFILSFTSVRNAVSIPPVRQVKIKIPKLKTNKKIVLISDVHIGKTLGKAFLQKLVAKINTLKPDIVAIVGDLVDDKIKYVSEDLTPLNDLQSNEGTYYVAGNHEYYHGIEDTLDFLSTLNLTILHNKNIELDGFNLAGVPDIAGERFNVIPPDLRSAKNGLNTQKPSILLAHQPKFVRNNDVNDFELVLCGHTHAGQVFPLSIFVWLDQHYIHGLYQISEKTQLYVSSGVGFWGPAIRFLAPSEIVCIELESTL